MSAPARDLKLSKRCNASSSSERNTGSSSAAVDPHSFMIREWSISDVNRADAFKGIPNGHLRNSSLKGS